MDKLSSIDLFAGAGGLSEGFRQAGFQSLFANDSEQPAMDTFHRNHSATLTAADNVENLDPHEIMSKVGLGAGDLDALIGGPPCQGFSTYGKRDEFDARNQLYLHFIRFLDAFQPKAYVIENVTGMLSMSGGRVIEDISARLRERGYGCSVWTLDAREYGVPQSRKRVFITGMRDGALLSKPEVTHALNARTVKSNDLFDGNLPAPLTVRDAISDLPAITLKPKQTHEELEYSIDAQTQFQREMREGSSSITHHSSKQMLGIRRLRLALLHAGDYGTRIEERLAQNGLSDDVIDEMLGGGAGLRDINECRTEDRKKELALREMLKSGHTSIDAIMKFMDSQGFANKYRRLHWDEPSHTLVAHMARDCSDFVHPTIDRFISVREAARMQTFPDTYYFEGSQFMQLRHIGNAVPPRLARAVATSVIAGLKARGSRQNAQTHRHPRPKMAEQI